MTVQLEIRQVHMVSMPFIRCAFALALLAGCTKGVDATTADELDAVADADANDGFGPCPTDKPAAGSPCTNEPWCFYDWRCSPCCGYTTGFRCEGGKWSGPSVEELPSCDVDAQPNDVQDTADSAPDGSTTDSVEVLDGAGTDAAAVDVDAALPDAATPACQLYEDHGGCYAVTPVCVSDADCDSGHCAANGHCNQWLSCGCVSDLVCNGSGQATGQKGMCITNNTACGMCVVVKPCATNADCSNAAYCTSEGYCQTKCCP